METGFFKWVWRFNALAIALVALLALGAITYELGRDLARTLFPTRTTNTLVMNPADAPGEAVIDDTIKRYFGTPSAATADGTYALPLYVEQTYSNRSISKSSVGNLVNYRIVETAPQSNRWLFPPAERLILNTYALVLRESGQANLPMGQLMTVTDSDTNEDGRLSPQETTSAFLTDATWGEPVKIVDGVHSLLSHTVRTSDMLDLIYNTDAGTHIAQVSLLSGAILSQQIVTPED